MSKFATSWMAVLLISCLLTLQSIRSSLSIVANFHDVLSLGQINKTDLATTTINARTILSSNSSSIDNTQTQTNPPGAPTRAAYPKPTFLKGVQDLRYNDNDEFAAAWWMSRRRYERVELEYIANVEGDAFIPIRWAGQGMKDVRMALDWLDFSIEHLSKWQKLIASPQGNHFASQTCQLYTRKKLQRLVSSKSPQTQQQYPPHHSYMNQTLVVIPYGVPDHTDTATQEVWVSFLQATIASLLPHGPKRIVVVGYYPLDAQLAAKAFWHLLQPPPPPLSQHPFGTPNTTITSPESLDPKSLTQHTFFVVATELAFVHTTDVRSKFVEENVPRGALVGLQHELIRPHLPNPNVTGTFLGRHTPQDFEHIYMTEADQILTARLSETFWDKLGHGKVIVPHRLQPVPHAKDLGEIELPPRLNYPLPTSEDFAVIHLDDPVQASCCDAPDHRGTSNCDDNFWWACGYDMGNFSNWEHHFLLSLSGSGTGIASLAGNEHGRRCTPHPRGRGGCRPTAPKAQGRRRARYDDAQP